MKIVLFLSLPFLIGANVQAASPEPEDPNWRVVAAFSPGYDPASLETLIRAKCANGQISHFTYQPDFQGLLGSGVCSTGQRAPLIEGRIVVTHRYYSYQAAGDSLRDACSRGTLSRVAIQVDGRDVVASAIST
jgi:hypothetical protein